MTDKHIQYGPPPLRPGYRWETREERDTRTCIGYRIERQHEGLWYVLASDGDRVARVGRFMPGPMVDMNGPRITSPAMARAVARAMIALADEIDGVGEVRTETS